MNLNQRRPLSHRVQVLEPIRTKADLSEILAEQDWALERGDVINKGEWNERREWFAVKASSRLRIGVVLKGERANWAGMLEMFNRGGF